MAVNPVVAYAVGITPAATVSGATPASTNDSTAGTPSRSAARARDTRPVLAAWRVEDIGQHSFTWGQPGPGAGRGQMRWASSAAPTAALVWVITSRRPASSRPAA